MLQKTIVSVLAVVFVLIGVGFVFAPETFTELATGESPDGGAPLTEIRAVSGGVALGLGLFFAQCARRPDGLATGLVLGALIGAGLALGRVVGFVLDGDVTGTQVAFAIVEVATVVVCLAGLRTTSSVER